MSIQPLPDDVIAQIKSSTTITNLNGVILELMKNCLDAGSTRVDISVDYGRGGCIVEDNGLGILPSEFGVDGGLGRLYCGYFEDDSRSKADGKTDSSRLTSQTPVHGCRGTFLTHLGAMSLLMITSHHHQHRSHNTLSMHKSEVVSRQVPAPALQYLSHSDHGTRVTVRNLFGNMPVRVKQRAVALEKQGGQAWESLKRSVVLLCLAWPHGVAVTIRELATNQRTVIRDASKSGLKTEIPRVCSILYQSSFITPEDKASWVSVAASTSSLEVAGAISLHPSPAKHVQFISFEIRPILAVEGQSILHDEINRLFMNSAFGNEEGAEEFLALERAGRANDAGYRVGGYTKKELKGERKGIDRWPMFYLNVQRSNLSGGSKSFDDEIFDNKAENLSAVIGLLRVMILEFLTKHHFRPVVARGQVAKGSSGEGEMPNVEKTPALLGRQKVSPKRSNSQKPKTSSLRNSKPDLLGTNVKLPSFRQSTLYSPFDAWSKMKSGNPKSSFNNANSLPIASSIQRPSTVPPSPSKRLPASTPLLSSTGTITRRPFDNVFTELSQSRTTPLRKEGASLSQSKTAMPQQPPIPIDLTRDDDDLVTWTNPITKVESVVNKRTGVASLPRSLSSPNVSLRQRIPSDAPSVPSQPSSWISALLERWENPVFCPTETSIPKISLDGEVEQGLHNHRYNRTQLEINSAFAGASSGNQGRISKKALRNAELIGQIDKKFILVKLLTLERRFGDGKMLVIIDQHAADERIRVESLLAELCTPRSIGMLSESTIVTTYLEKRIVFEVPEKDIELLRKAKGHFADWGILYDLPRESETAKAKYAGSRKQEFSVYSLPPGIVERCKSDPKLFIELIRMELYSNTRRAYSHDLSTPSEPDSKAWLTRIHRCPQGILNMINSRACRSAIMFNDALSKDQCEILIKRLADTSFPFQCAHGRPSSLPLVELGALGLGGRKVEQRGEDFGRAFRKWKLSFSNS